MRHEQPVDQGNVSRVEEPVSDLDGRAFARALRDAAACEQGIVLAEVFVRIALSSRWSSTGERSRSVQVREESGVALRLWDRQGREGFVHADAVARRSIGELAQRARKLASMTTPQTDLIPRLPSGTSPDPVEGSVVLLPDARSLASLMSRAETRLKGQGRSAFTMRESWSERAHGRTWIANSLGGEVSFPFAISSAGVQLV